MSVALSTAPGEIVVLAVIVTGTMLAVRLSWSLRTQNSSTSCWCSLATLDEPAMRCIACRIGKGNAGTEEKPGYEMIFELASRLLPNPLRASEMATSRSMPASPSMVEPVEGLLSVSNKTRYIPITSPFAG